MQKSKKSELGGVRAGWYYFEFLFGQFWNFIILDYPAKNWINP